jgi:hypothetical protein
MLLTLMVTLQDLSSLQEPLFINHPLPLLPLIMPCMGGVRFIVLHAAVRTHVGCQLSHMHAVLQIVSVPVPVLPRDRHVGGPLHGLAGRIAMPMTPHPPPAAAHVLKRATRCVAAVIMGGEVRWHAAARVLAGSVTADGRVVMGGGGCVSCITVNNHPILINSTTSVT